MLGHWQLYMLLSYSATLKFQRIWMRLIYLLLKIFVFQSSVQFNLKSETLTFEEWVANLSMAKRNIILTLSLNIAVFIVLTIGNNISKKQILSGFVERAELQAENQAILETLEVGIVSVSAKGIKYFNMQGEKTLIKAIMELDKDFETKQRCMNEINVIKEDIAKCKPHVDVQEERKAVQDCILKSKIFEVYTEDNP